MKLIIAVLQLQDVDACADAMTAGGFVCTRIASQGGFLDSTNCTLLCGVDDSDVESVLAIFAKHARRRNQMMADELPLPGALARAIAPTVDVEVGGATVFVLPLERFEKL
jgi:uncharacterized protein YaaQ